MLLERKKRSLKVEERKQLFTTLWFGFLSFFKDTPGRIVKRSQQNYRRNLSRDHRHKLFSEQFFQTKHNQRQQQHFAFYRKGRVGFQCISSAWRTRGHRPSEQGKPFPIGSWWLLHGWWHWVQWRYGLRSCQELMLQIICIIPPLASFNLQ